MPANTMPAPKNRVAKVRPGVPWQAPYVTTNTTRRGEKFINNRTIYETVRKHVSKFPGLRVETVMYINAEIVDLVGVGKTWQYVRETVETRDEKIPCTGKEVRNKNRRSGVWRNQKIVVEKSYLLREPDVMLRERAVEILKTFQKAGEWEEWGWKRTQLIGILPESFFSV